MRSKPLNNAPEVVDGGLVRRLGPFDLVLLGIGASIGAGIFVVTGTVARDVGPGMLHVFMSINGAAVLCYFSYNRFERFANCWYRAATALLAALS
uniref:Cationic amino acid transporter 9, chloroplastic-like n=1 Tax=Tanacetum cinerariifolium TaxID=118510 RepID=A0A699K7E8_TANCI|nr:cationic amino acid transporter 9, chloroplastic-like [Tanacetum cinerariifolium]